MRSLAEKILEAYDARACWICGNPGLCGHREGRVEAAYIEAREARPAGPNPVQVMREKPKTFGGVA